eukprot:PhF_6_TR20634/c0_g1_i1/m.29729
MQRAQRWFLTFWQNLLSLTLLEALSAVIVGTLGGIFPIPGITTAVTLFLANICSHNKAQLAIATSLNFLLTPVDLYMIPVFANWSGSVFGAEVYSASMLTKWLSEGVMALLSQGGGMVMYAILSWFLVTIVAVLVLHFVKDNKGDRIE